jgi:hypothetical protein
MLLAPQVNGLGPKAFEPSAGICVRHPGPLSVTQPLPRSPAGFGANHMVHIRDFWYMRQGGAVVDVLQVSVCGYQALEMAQGCFVLCSDRDSACVGCAGLSAG